MNFFKNFNQTDNKEEVMLQLSMTIPRKTLLKFNIKDSKMLIKLQK